MIWKYKTDGLIKEVELKNNPVIITVNKFDEVSAKEFNNKVSMAHSTGQKIIPIVIDSYGGQVYSLMSMISTIKNSELPVATIVKGKAMSCGAILFTFGEKGMRYMSEDATLMIHDVSSGQYGKVEELKANAEESDRLNEEVYKMMARNCGHADNFFIKKVHDRGRSDWYIASKEAKKLKLADHIRVPKMSVNINVNIEIQ